MNQPGDDNPWKAPEAFAAPWVFEGEGPARILNCPECQTPMEPGYLTTGAWLYWREWQDRSLLVRFSDRLPKTLPTFLGINRLSGFRCRTCEVIVFRFGDHRLEWKGPDEPAKPVE